MRTSAPWLAYMIGGITGTAVAAIAAVMLLPNDYSSTAILRAHQTTEPAVEGVKRNVLSRSSLLNLVNTYALYPDKRQQEPLEDTIERMREHIQIRPDAGSIHLSFRYSSPVRAQRIAQELASRLIHEFDRDQTNRGAFWIQALRDQVETAARDWDQAAEAARKSPSPRAAFDADLAKQHYASLKTKLAEAKDRASLIPRQMGPRLELIAPASTPPEQPFQWALLPTGLLLGLAATAFARGFR